MDAREAQQIIQKLADGVDPYSGERYPPDSPYQRAATEQARGQVRRGVIRRGVTSGEGSQARGTGEGSGLV